MAIQFTNYQLFIDPVSQVAFRAYGDFATVPTPVFTEGDKVRLELYFVTQTNVPGSLMQFLPFPSGTVNVQIGAVGEEEIISTDESTPVPVPEITAGTSAGGVTPFTIDDRAFRGFFTIRVNRTSSPAFDRTTRAIQYPIDINLMQQALIDMVGTTLSSWSQGEATVIQTGELTGAIQLFGKYNDTTFYNLAGNNEVTITSNLTGYSGVIVDLDFSDPAVGTFLGNLTSRPVTLEVQVTDESDTQTYLQLDCVIRKQVLSPAP
jgi:hypothetical protein